MSANVLGFLQRWLFNTLAVFAAAYIVPGIRYDSFASLIAASLVLGILNAILRPLLVLVALPLLLLTLGLFFFIINALLLSLVGSVVKGFHVQSFWAALFGSLIITCVTLFLNSLTRTGSARIMVSRGQRRPNRRDDDNGPVIDV